MYNDIGLYRKKNPFRKELLYLSVKNGPKLTVDILCLSQLSSCSLYSLVCIRSCAVVFISLGRLYLLEGPQKSTGSKVAQGPFLLT